MGTWEKERYFPDPPPSLLESIGNIAVGFLKLILALCAGAATLCFWGVVFSCMLVPVAIGIWAVAWLVSKAVGLFL